jgi:DNA-directed RNA polymerase subunit K/omega
MAYKKIIVVNDHITSDALSKFEIAEIIAKRVDNITKGGKINLSIEDMLIPVDERRELGNEVVLYNGKKYVKITNTTELVKKELDLNKCPYLIERKLYEDENTLHVEYRDPNKMIKPILLT